jgi:leader peptidase (prepilin peptidase) / N-methyltransferase
MEFTYIFHLIIVCLVGLTVGSFINVCIYRFPRKESVIFPPSHCPICGVPIKYRDNIPIISYIILKGKCRSCSSPISIQYPLVEFLTACLIVTLFIQEGLTLNFLSDAILGILLLTAAIIDGKHMIIPNRLTYPGALIAVVMSLRWGIKGIVRGIGGTITGIVILAFMYSIGKLLFKKDSVGMGDFKLAIVIGFFLGPLLSAAVLFIAIFIGGLWGCYMIIMKKVGRGSEVPFGPFIAIGGIAVIIFRSQILALIESYISFVS